MKKLYIILLAALLLTLAACLTACSAKPVSLRGTEAPNLPGPTNDALKVTDEGQDWNITLEQVDKENFAEDDRLLAKGSYQVFQLNQEGSGDTLTATAAAAEGINAYFEQWRKDQLQFLGDVTNLARDAYAGVNGEDSRWEQPEYVYSDTVTTDYWVGPKLLCVEMHYSSYSGGAHPNSWRRGGELRPEHRRGRQAHGAGRGQRGPAGRRQGESAVPDPRERHLGGIRSRGLLRGL